MYVKLVTSGREEKANYFIPIDFITLKRSETKQVSKVTNMSLKLWKKLTIL